MRISQEISQLEARLNKLKSAVSAASIASPDTQTGDISEAQVRELQRARRLRDRMLGAELFADAGWDILLEAFASHLAQTRTSVSDLRNSSAVPPTTALRWIKNLENEGWLIRKPDWFDGRRQWIEISPEGIRRMVAFFRAAGDRCLAI